MGFLSMDDWLSKRGIFGEFFDDSDAKGREAIESGEEAFDWAKPEDMSYDMYSPEQYRSAGDYNPVTAHSQLIAEDPSLRSGQMSYLNKLAGFADDGLTDQDKAAYDRALQEAGQMARGRSEATMNNALARGMSGGGMAFAQAEMANQDGATRAHNNMLDRNAQSAQGRYLYNKAYGDALGGMRQQDLQVNSKNADIINEFNRYNTNNQNYAQRMNLGNQQEIMNQNTKGRNDASKFNIESKYKGGRDNQNQRLNWAKGRGGYADTQADFYAGQGKRRADARAQDEERVQNIFSMGMGGGF